MNWQNFKKLKAEAKNSQLEELNECYTQLFSKNLNGC